MADIDTLFTRLKADAARLLSFGFSENETGYSYSTGLFDWQFEMTVTVAKSGEISAELIENSSQESYTLHRVAGAAGAFVGRIREEYEQTLTRVANACFEPDVFKSQGAKQVIQHIKEKYRDEPEFLWKRFPDNAIFRRQDNAKWYAALLTVRKVKLGLGKEGSIEVLDLRPLHNGLFALLLRRASSRAKVIYA